VRALLTGSFVSVLAQVMHSQKQQGHIPETHFSLAENVHRQERGKSKGKQSKAKQSKSLPLGSTFC
jgi:hypothetical protein